MANGLTYQRKVTTPESLKQLAASLAPYVRPGDAIMLNGDLGAGKTQFVQGFAEALGAKEKPVSPTFNIVLSYETDSVPLYHFDLYRLENMDELDDIGFYDILEGDGVSCVEWANKFPQLPLYDFITINIERIEDVFGVTDADSVSEGTLVGPRLVTIHSYGERSRSLLFVWASDSKSHLVKTTW